MLLLNEKDFVVFFFDDKRVRGLFFARAVVDGDGAMLSFGRRKRRDLKRCYGES